MDTYTLVQYIHLRYQTVFRDFIIRFMNDIRPLRLSSPARDSIVEEP